MILTRFITIKSIVLTENVFIDGFHDFTAYFCAQNLVYIDNFY